MINRGPVSPSDNMIPFVGLLALLVVLGLVFNLIEVQALFILVVAGFIFVITAYRLIYGLGLLILAVGLSPEIQVSGIPIRVEDLIVPVIFFFWFFRQISLKRPLKPSNMNFSLLSFLFFMGIATIHAFIVNPDMNRIIASFYFLKHVQYLLIFLLVFNIVQSRDGLKFLTVCGVGAAVILGLQSILVPVGVQGGDIITAFRGEALGGQELQRLRGVITETANIFGGYLMFHMLLIAGFYLEEKSVKKKIGFAICFLIMLYPALLTLSRSTYVGLLMGLAFLGMMKEPKILMGLVLLPIIGLTVLPPEVLERMMSIFQAFSSIELTPAWQARLNAWRVYLPEVIRHPFIGRGLYFIPPGEIDNEFVFRAVQTGILGLLSFIWVFWNFIRRAYFNLKQRAEQFDVQLSLGYLAAMVGITFHALAATSFTAIRTAQPIYFFSGLIVANYLIILNISPHDSSTELKRRETNLRMKIEQESSVRPKFNRNSSRENV